MVSELSRFFKLRATEKNDTITSLNIALVLNPRNFRSDRQYDAIEAWDNIMEQLFQELILVQSEWARNMYVDLSKLLHMQTFREEKCLNEKPSDARCKKATSNCITGVSVALFLSTPSVDDADMKETTKAKKNVKQKYFLTKYISNYRHKLFQTNTCNYCNSQKESEFQITKKPVILKVNFERTNHLGGPLKTPVIFPMKLSLGGVDYDFIAMNHHVDGEYEEEEGHTGHNVATAIREGKLFHFDDDIVSERTIPKSGTFTRADIVSVIYQRVDWADYLQSDTISQIPEYPLMVHNIYKSLKNEISKCKKEKKVSHESMLSDTRVIDNGKHNKYLLFYICLHQHASHKKLHCHQKVAYMPFDETKYLSLINSKNLKKGM